MRPMSLPQRTEPLWVSRCGSAFRSRGTVPHNDHQGVDWRPYHVLIDGVLPFPFTRQQDCERAVLELNLQFPNATVQDVRDRWNDVRALLSNCCAW